MTDLAQILHSRHDKRFGLQCVVLKMCSSTMDIAMEHARNDGSDGLVVVAEKQTKSRGRLGRIWLTQDEGLSFSVIVRPQISLAHAPRLTLLTAWAVFRALKTLNVPAFVKWPNDIWIKSFHKDSAHSPLAPLVKIAGILVETQSKGAKLEAAVIGLGINMFRGQNAKKLTEEVPFAGFLADGGHRILQSDLLCAILDELEQCLKDPESDAIFKACLDELAKNSATLNKHVSVEDHGSSVHGFAEGFADDGALVLRKDDGEMVKIYAGDVWPDQAKDASTDTPPSV